MKPFNSTLFWLPLLLAAVLLTPRPATADVSVSFDFFQDNLDPYGEWVEIEDYGHCWRPTGVDDGWRPYADGYWAYTDVGWTWVSYEDFGGITYHYGRWFRADECGWVWRPDYEWAPAWVSWRHSDDYVGWAPLPPEARWNRSIGFGFGVDLAFDIGPAYYNFCETGSFGSPALRPLIIDNSQNISIINQTTNVTNITYNNNVIYNGGPSYEALAARSAKPIPTMKLVRQTDAAAMRLAAKNKRFAQAKGDELLVVAPGVKGPKDGKIKPAKVGKKFGKVKVDKGWDGVKDPQEKEKIQAKMKEGVKGDPKEVKAKPVDPADIEVVKNKAGKGKNKGTAAAGQAAEQRKKNKDVTEASEATPGESVAQPADGSEMERGRAGRGKVGKEGGKVKAPDGSSPVDEPVVADESRKNARKKAGLAENDPLTKNKNDDAERSAKAERQQRQAAQAEQQQQEAQQAAAAKAARQREKARVNGAGEKEQQQAQGAERAARQQERQQEAAREAARAARQQQQQEASKASRQQQNQDAERAQRQQQRQEQALQQQRAAQQQQQQLQRQERGVQQQQRQQQAAQQQQRAAQQQQRQQQVAQQQMRQQQAAQQQMRQQQVAQQRQQLQQAAGQPQVQPGAVQRQGKKKGKRGEEENQQ